MRSLLLSMLTLSLVCFISSIGTASTPLTFQDAFNPCPNGVCPTPVQGVTVRKPLLRPQTTIYEAWDATQGVVQYSQPVIISQGVVEQFTAPVQEVMTTEVVYEYTTLSNAMYSQCATANMAVDIQRRRRNLVTAWRQRPGLFGWRKRRGLCQ